MYFVAYLDRVNVGFAALQMNAALGFSGRVYGLGAGIFFPGLFLFEGLPAVVLGMIALQFLTDRPEGARWLPADEKSALVAALARDRDRDPHTHAVSLRAGLLNAAVWRLAAVLFLIVTSGYGFSFFLPQIVKKLSGASDIGVGLWSA